MRWHLVALGGLLITGSAGAVTLQVAPGGATDPAGPGPYASLQVARDAIRAQRADWPAGEAIVVEVADGTYPLAAPLLLTPADSGTPGQPVTYQAAPGAQPVFTAGQAVTGLTARPDGLWAAQVAGVGPDWRPEQLYVNGRHATRARSPNQGFFYTVREADTESRQQAILDPAEATDLVGLSAEELGQVNFVAYFSWESGRLRPESYDPATGLLRLTGSTPWPITGFYGSAVRQRYQLENYRAALDEPGEWYLSADGELLYWPLPGEDLATTELVLPRAERFLIIGGEPELGLTVDHLTFRGLAFRHAAYYLPPQGHSDGQAEVGIDATVMVDGASNITFEQCEFSQLGRYAMWFRAGCSQITVQECLLDELGAGGIKVGLPDSNLTETDPRLTHHVVIDNNIIQHGGWLHHGAHGVWIAASPDNQVTHNDIGGFNYTGVSVGWRWGYEPSVAKRNIIDYNHIHHIGNGLLSDMGGIYTLGPSEGTTLRHNVITDVNDYGYIGRGGWGLYNDEGSTGILLENNLVLRTRTGGYHLHYGADLTIRNNIFADTVENQLQHSRNEEHHQYTFENNIVWYRTGELFHGDWTVPQIDLDRNVYWRADDQPVDFSGRTFEEWQALGRDPNSIVADPLFVDPEGGDWTLRADSPAIPLGFVPFDPSEAGVYGRPEWIARARQATWPPVVRPGAPPPPPPMTFALDFESAAVGSLVPRASFHAGSENPPCGVVAEPGPAGGARCLRLTDAPGQVNEFDPHFAWDPRHESGQTRFSFDLKVSAGAHGFVEWRDAAQPYRPGPRLAWDGELLTAGGRDVGSLPVDTWVRVTMASGVGADKTATWSLTIAPYGGAAREYTDLPPMDAAWDSLRWLGFSSTADAATTLWLDNLTLEHTP